jgi:myo-inositol 2-dehydrogenase / D-chiro-inositol 1-dehydrogenase
MHAANLAATRGVTEVLLHDPVPGRAAEVAATLNGAAAASGRADGGAPVTAVDGAEQALKADGVLITTSTPSHAEVLLRCVEAGVPALCEKPLAGDLGTMRMLVERVEAAGVPVLVGFQRRFDPAIAELRRRVAAGEVGDVYLVRALAMDHEPPDLSYIPGSGGIYRDLFIHDLDAVPWLVGEPVVEVHAVGSVLVHPAFGEAGDVDTAVATLRFAGGAIAQLAGGRKDGVGYDHRIEVIGSKDALGTGYDPRSPFRSLEPGGHRPGPDAYTGFQERFGVAYANQMQVFCDVIAGRAENPSPVRDSLVSFALAEACDASLRSGRPVRLDPAG